MTRLLKSEDDFTIIGEIVGVHGIKGELKVAPLTDHIERFSLLKQIYLKKESNFFKKDIKNLRYHKNTVLLKVKGIENRTVAEQYRNQYIYIPTSERLPLNKDQYYINDLIGLKVFENDRYLGILTDVLQPGAHDVYVIKHDKELLIPAIKDVILEINIPEKCMKVKLLEGLEEL